MRAVALVLVLAAAVGGCRNAPPGRASPDAVRGRVEGPLSYAKDARVQIYRLDDGGRPTPDPFETVAVDRTGRFTTRVLSPGLYRIVYRHSDGPPSKQTVHVPAETEAVLRPVMEAGLVQLRVVGMPGSDPVACRLTQEKPDDGIPDVREFRATADAPTFIPGLRPGWWYLDLPDTGQTTQVELPAGAALRDLVVNPPAAVAGGSVHGELRRVDGTAAAWLAVTARPLAADGASADRWGRFALTDRSGGYRIVGIPPGTALVRVECREVPIRILPSPLSAVIPPSGDVLLGFVVEP